MSIFSGWNRESFATLVEALTSSQEGLVAFVVIVLAAFLSIGFVVFFASHQIGGFFLKIREDDERIRKEEEEEAMETADSSQTK